MAGWGSWGPCYPSPWQPKNIGGIDFVEPPRAAQVCLYRWVMLAAAIGHSEGSRDVKGFHAGMHGQSHCDAGLTSVDGDMDSLVFKGGSLSHPESPRII